MDISQQAGADKDPRTTGEYVRRLPGDSGTLTLVGVVHDHPASTYRVRRITKMSSPDILALELPPLAIPLFEQYARDDRSPPTFGGEMSAAMQIARTDTTVGIDRPTCSFFLRLARNVLYERPSLTIVQNLLSGACSVTKHAIVCRLAAAVAARTPVRLEVDFPTAHDTDWWDTPEDQALDERRQIRRSRSFIDAMWTDDISCASRLEDSTREEHMADRLSALREEGDIVAIVGIDHLDSLRERLEG
jgi:hypothetical protein